MVNAVVMKEYYYKINNIKSIYIIYIIINEKILIYPHYLNYKKKFIPTVFDVKTMNVIIGTKFIFEWNPVKALKVLV